MYIIHDSIRSNNAQIHHLMRSNYVLFIYLFKIQLKYKLSSLF